MNRFTDKFKKADDSFDNQYSKIIEDLKGLSEEEIKSVTPNVSDYDKLLKAVKEASDKNLSQARLVKNIKDLGEVAIKLSKKIPTLKKLF